MNRGSDGKPGLEKADLLRFNEAPIHESGKWKTRTSFTKPGSGFNEAPIHESGKYDG